MPKSIFFSYSFSFLILSSFLVFSILFGRRRSKRKNWIFDSIYVPFSTNDSTTIHSSLGSRPSRPIWSPFYITLSLICISLCNRDEYYLLLGTSLIEYYIELIYTFLASFPYTQFEFDYRFISISKNAHEPKPARTHNNLLYNLVCSLSVARLL